MAWEFNVHYYIDSTNECLRSLELNSAADGICFRKPSVANAQASEEELSRVRRIQSLDEEA